MTDEEIAQPTGVSLKNGLLSTLWVAVDELLGRARCQADLRLFSRHSQPLPANAVRRPFSQIPSVWLRLLAEVYL